MWALAGGAWLGWALGANDAANVMGAAVSSRMVRFRTGVLLAAVFVFLGAAIGGQAGIQTYVSLAASINLREAVMASVAAAATVTVLGLLGLPISASQAVVGGIVGVNLLQGNASLAGVGTIVVCWVATPAGALLIGATLYLILGVLYNALRPTMFQSDAGLRIGLLLVTAYGAYVLGANNVANVVGVFVGAGYLGPMQGALLGGGCMALGVLTCQRQVVETVGSRLVPLNSYSAFVVALATGMTVHVFTRLGVPVSTTQAVVGAVLGVGLARGMRTVQVRTLGQIALGWVFTPLMGAAFALLIHVLMHVRYVP
jgi:PiT family inorganic phosphate transporter